MPMVVISSHSTVNKTPETKMPFLDPFDLTDV